MNHLDLLHELLRVCDHARHAGTAVSLARAGVPAASGEAWGFDRVEINDYTYQPSLNGTPAVVVPHFEAGQLLDLVAVGLRSRSCRSLLGICTVLGTDHLNKARWEGKPARFYTDPIEWFANRRDGAVVVDWRAVRFELQDLPGIACDDERTARRIDRALRTPSRMPPIFVREAAHAA